MLPLASSPEARPVTPASGGAPAPRRTIVIVSESYIPRISGVTVSLVDMVRALRALGHRVLVVAPRYPGYRDDDPDVLRLPSVPAPGTPEFPLLLPTVSGLLRDARIRQADIIHVQSPFLAGRVGAVLARRLRRPLLYSQHTFYQAYLHYVPLIPPAITRPAVLWWVRRFANRCSVVIVTSEAVRRFLREEGVTVPIELLPTGGVDPAQYVGLDGRAARARHGIPADRSLLVTVSRLAPEKSVDLLLRAFQQVTGPAGAYLLIVGDGPAAPSLRGLTRELGIAERTRFAGALPHDDALAAMAGGDLFVFASQTETEGLVLLEAMMAGLPVVAVGRAGAAEMVRHGETGLLVEPAPEALAAAVRQLLSDPARRDAMGRRAREVAATYAYPVLASRLAALYEAVIEQENVTPQRS